VLPDDDKQLREKAAQLFKKSAARAAFAHLGNVAIRTGVGLEYQGLADRRSETVLDEDVIDIVTNPDSSRRNKSSPGPILFYRQRSDEKKQFALDVSELLLSDHLQTRIGALRHFRFLAADRGLMTLKTLSVLDSASEDISAIAPAVWQKVALDLYDAIRNDLLCIAAGARQSIEQHYEDGIQQYFPKLMRPPLSAIDGLGIEMFSSNDQASTASTIIQAIVKSSGSFSEACDRYIDQIGFLPVTGTGSFSAFVRVWAENHGSAENPSPAVKAWKSQCVRPLSAYHACAYFLNTEFAISENAKADYWQEFIELISRSAKDLVDDKCSIWRFHAELARHFCHYLEVRLPGSQGDAIPRIAMWLSNCVINLIGANEQAIAAFRTNGILSECYESEFNWRLTNPPGIRTPLWVAIQGQAAIWAYALMSALTHEKIQEFKGVVNDDIRRALERAFAVICVRNYVGYSDRSETISYDFEKSFTEIADVWIQEFGKSEAFDSIVSFSESRQLLTDTSEFTNALKSLATEFSVEDQVFLISAIDLFAKRGTLNLEAIWTSLSNQQWRSAVFKRLPEDLVEALCTALSSCLGRAPVQWSIELPHFYQSACEDMADSKERSDLFFGWIVLSSVHTYSVGAIERILRGSHSADMVARALTWRRELIEHIPDAAPWTIARLRSVVASLSTN
jgi:hypothetical protein